jgi:hypothetical protein
LVFSPSRSLFARLGRPTRRVLGVAVTAATLVTSAGCYDSTSLRVTVRSPPTALDCTRTVDSVFFDAAYVRLNSVTGPDLFYTPRMPPRTMFTAMSILEVASAMGQTDLGWGIGVWLKDDSKDRSASGSSVCGFELEALSPDPEPSMSKHYSTQRGEPFDRAVRDMAQRLTVAFEGSRPPG